MRLPWLTSRPSAGSAPLCALVGLLGLLSFWAPTSQGQPGDLTGFSFLRLEPSARASALGGAFSAIVGDDVNALFYNPALLNETMQGALSLSYLNHLSGLNAGFVAYGHHLEGVGSVGAGLRFLSWGSMDERDEQGEKTGTFSAADLALTVGVARAYRERLRYGANVHVVYTGIASYSASALAADVGLVYHLEAQRLSLSASVNHVGVTLSSLGATRDRLPVDVRLSVAKRLAYLPLLLSVTGYNLHDLGSSPSGATGASAFLEHLAFGGEFQFSEAFNLRVGYNHRRHEELKMSSRLDLAGFGLGFGLKISRFGFDYAYNSWSELGGLHQFTVRTNV